MEAQDTIITRLDQCQYGLWIKEKGVELLAKKPTKFMTNPPAIAQELGRRCEGADKHIGGRHASLFDGRAKMAQVYPPRTM